MSPINFFSKIAILHILFFLFRQFSKKRFYMRILKIKELTNIDFYHMSVKTAYTKYTNIEHCHTWNFAPGWNFQNQPRLKKICVTLEFQPGAKLIYFYFISIRGENIFAKICSTFYENVLRKKTFRMQLQDYIKTMMLDFINKRNKMFNFKTFKIVLLATINSKIVTASLLLNLYSCY